MKMGTDPPPPSYETLTGGSLMREISLPHVLSQGENNYGRQVSEEQRRAYLATLNLPAGIAEEILQSCRIFPLRIWVIDNSGSMATGDGHKLLQGYGGRQGMVPCSRWGELGDAILWHASLAAHLGAPTEFRLLNAPAAVGGGTFQVIQCGIGDPTAEIMQVQEMLKTDPIGRTPLCQQITEVVRRVKEEEPRLRSQGLRAVVMIASDGAATDGNIEVAMRPLRDLPVWTIVRLCTDDDQVVEYWNGIDEDLELDMDVLDDLTGEAGEVAEGNSWITYGAPLHRLREWGTSRKVLDLMDEAPLDAAQMRELVILIAGVEIAGSLPDPSSWSEFEKAIAVVNSKMPHVWDPIRSRQRPWFSVKKLKKRFSGRPTFCAIM